MRTPFRTVLILACLLTPLAVSAGGAGRYLPANSYLASAFPAGVPAPRTLWIGGELRKDMEDILGNAFPALRVRYWYNGTTSAWILDQVGKEQPITIGVTVSDNAIEAVHILEYRESRGWEVRYPFFTDQFRGVHLASGEGLDRRIDGITGATLSVRAVTRVAQVALLLHDRISHPS